MFPLSLAALTASAFGALPPAALVAGHLLAGAGLLASFAGVVPVATFAPPATPPPTPLAAPLAPAAPSVAVRRATPALATAGIGAAAHNCRPARPDEQRGVSGPAIVCEPAPEVGLDVRAFSAANTACIAVPAQPGQQICELTVARIPVAWHGGTAVLQFSAPMRGYAEYAENGAVRLALDLSTAAAGDVAGLRDALDDLPICTATPDATVRRAAAGGVGVVHVDFAMLTSGAAATVIAEPAPSPTAPSPDTSAMPGGAATFVVFSANATALGCLQ